MAAVKRVGEILLENGFINEQQLKEALELQKVFPDNTVGQLLCKLGYLSESDLNYILEQKGKRQKLADVLLKERLITSDVLEEVQKASRAQNVPLEKMLLRKGAIDESNLARAIALQYDLPFVVLSTLTFDPALRNVVNASFAKRQKIVPVARIGNTLTLAMSRPIAFHELKDLEQTFRLKLLPVIATESEITQALQRLYHLAPGEQQEDLSELVDSSVGDLLLKAHESPDEPDVEEESLRVTETDSVIVKLVNKVVLDAYQMGASDIHIEPYPGKEDILIRIRVDGVCKVYQKVPYRYKYAIPSRLKIMANLDIAERRRPQDGKINFRRFGPLDVELRVATMPTAGNMEDVVLRLLSSGPPLPFVQLGLTEHNQGRLQEAVSHAHGLVLVVGPTGSGKTTTLHAAIALINQPDRKIWTAEDPVEITQAGLRQVQVNPRLGFTFAAAMRSFLRLDPDVIMVGEMRDLETAAIAVEASLTGHLVLSTLHTNSAPETITRLLDLGLDPFSFSDSLLCISSQRLARKLCLDCRKTRTPSSAELAELEAEFGKQSFATLVAGINQPLLAEPGGCMRCQNSGYRGRIGIHELLVCTPELKALIRCRADTDLIRGQAERDGMVSLKQDGILKALQGITDLKEIRRVSST